MASAVFEGASVGPLVDLAIQIDPSVLVAAFVGTALAFACFSDIIEKAHLGDLDYVKHALTLFTDFVAVFVRLLIIMVREARMHDPAFF
ncbi:hypothetical protein V6N13_096036 [Hibiscus sabdariffa]|uniref:Uncharacterized protein n=1 Tax=Hibiscus sabdariffa TaxID=183260 RepID=A0ABR2DGX2_9ROSI